ncbi:MAG: AcrR family transcriptional regulator [Gammaproteobacteria bacterium]|jgi:AcrR family transcriptional regulator
MRPRDDQKIEAIFNATLKLSGSYGLSGLTMNKIAKEARIAHGTLYIYFENKELLINELYKNIHKQRSFSKMSTIAHLPLKEQLCSLWESSLKYRLNNPFLLIFATPFIISPFISPECKKL